MTAVTPWFVAFRAEATKIRTILSFVISTKFNDNDNAWQGRRFHVSFVSVTH